MPFKCCAPNCKNDSRASDCPEGLSFHPLPLKNHELLAKWMQNMNADFKPKASSRLCSLHFTESDFEIKTPRKGNRKGGDVKKLKAQTVPTVFNWPQDPASTSASPVSLACVHCQSFSCVTESDLRAHINAIHLGYFPVGCGHCLDNGVSCWLATEEKLDTHNQHKHKGLNLEIRLNLEEGKEKRVVDLVEKCLNKKKKSPRVPKVISGPIGTTPAGNLLRPIVQNRTKRRKMTPEHESNPKPITQSKKESEMNVGEGIDLLLSAAQDLSPSKSPSEAQSPAIHPASVAQAITSQIPTQPPARYSLSSVRQTQNDAPEGNDAQIDVESLDVSAESTEKSNKSARFSLSCVRQHGIPEEGNETKSDATLETVKSIQKTESNSPSYYIVVPPSAGNEKMVQNRPEDPVKCIVVPPHGPAFQQNRPWSRQLRAAKPKPKVELQVLSPHVKCKAFLNVEPGFDRVSETPSVAAEEEVQMSPEYEEESFEESPKPKRRKKEPRVVKPSETTGLRFHQIGKVARVASKGAKNQLTFKCSKCNDSFACTKQHVMSKHLSAALYSCSYCQFEGGHLNSIKRHLVRKHSDQPFVFLDNTNDDLNEELAQVHLEVFGFDFRSVKFACALCDQLVGYGMAMVRHAADRRHPAARKCGHCGIILRDLSAMAVHQHDAHRGLENRFHYPPQSEIYNGCFPPDSRPIEFEPQVKEPICRINVQCLKCGVRVSVESATHHARAHCSNTASKYFCPYCAESNARYKVIQTHVKRKHPRKTNYSITPGKGIKSENREIVLDCFGFNKVECAYCHLTPSFRQVHRHVNQHLTEIGHSVGFAEMAQRCFEQVLYMVIE